MPLGAGWRLPAAPSQATECRGPEARSPPPAPSRRPPGLGTVLSSTGPPKQACAPGLPGQLGGSVACSGGQWGRMQLLATAPGPQLPWTRGGAGVAQGPAQGRMGLVAAAARIWLPGVAPLGSRSPSPSGQRGLWPVKSCALCQHVSQPSRPGEPPRHRVPINSPAWPSPTSGAQSRAPRAPGRGRAGAQGPPQPPREAC